MQKLKNKALEILAIREYSPLELKNKLKGYDYDNDEIDMVITELVNLGYVSNSRYIESFLQSKSRKYGVNRLRAILNAKTGEREEVSQALLQSNIDEYAMALNIWEKKFGAKPKNKAELARQIRFLQYRGFNLSIIRKVIDSKED